MQPIVFAVDVYDRGTGLLKIGETGQARGLMGQLVPDKGVLEIVLAVAQYQLTVGVNGVGLGAHRIEKRVGEYRFLALMRRHGGQLQGFDGHFSGFAAVYAQRGKLIDDLQAIFVVHLQQHGAAGAFARIQRAAAHQKRVRPGGQLIRRRDDGEYGHGKALFDMGVQKKGAGKNGGFSSVRIIGHCADHGAARQLGVCDGKGDRPGVMEGVRTGRAAVVRIVNIRRAFRRNAQGDILCIEAALRGEAEGQVLPLNGAAVKGGLILRGGVGNKGRLGERRRRRRFGGRFLPHIRKLRALAARKKQTDHDKQCEQSGRFHTDFPLS